MRGSDGSVLRDLLSQLLLGVVGRAESRGYDIFQFPEFSVQFIRIVSGHVSVALFNSPTGSWAKQNGSTYCRRDTNSAVVVPSARWMAQTCLA